MIKAKEILYWVIFWVNGKKAKRDGRPDGHADRQTSKVVLSAAFCSKKHAGLPSVFVVSWFLRRDYVMIS